MNNIKGLQNRVEIATLNHRRIQTNIQCIRNQNNKAFCIVFVLYFEF